MSSADPFYEAISPARDALKKPADSMDSDPGLTPDASSPGMREIASQPEFLGDWGDEPVEHAHTIAVWKRVLAVDCAHAMVRDLHDDPALPESSARSIYDDSANILSQHRSTIIERNHPYLRPH